MSSEKPVIVQSMVASQSHTPAVMLRLGDESVNMSVEDARTIGGQLIEAAETAQQDAFFLQWMMRMGLSEDAAAALLGEFRVRRNASKGEPDTEHA